MKYYIAVVIALVIIVTGCKLFKEFSTDIHQTVAVSLQKAYDDGGAEKVSAKIDALVVEGKLSTVQAEKLKAALQKGYDSMQGKLSELSVKDSPADTKTE